jgi:hypothetical protein
MYLEFNVPLALMVSEILDWNLKELYFCEN